MPRILVIDDDDGLRHTLAEVLTATGFVVLAAADGAAGVALARAQVPDLILSDVNMPGLDGYGVLEKIRQHPKTTNIEFILMTGRANLRGMREGMTRGADDYLPKPFDLEELVKTVSARLHKHESLRREAEAQMAELRTSLTMMLPHELLTPLSGILGLGGIIVDEARTLTPAELIEYGTMIQQSGNRLHRLIQNFLLQTQIELFGSDPVKLAGLRRAVAPNVAGVVETLARRKAAQAGRQADLTLVLADASASISGEFFAKIVEELLDNACKFSRPGSPVSVSTTEETGRVVLTISDRGHGMKPGDIARIGACVQFDRKLHEQQGSGLGLDIARRLTELHGGKFVLESQPGVGTTVRVELPGRGT